VTIVGLDSKDHSAFSMPYHLIHIFSREGTRPGTTENTGHPQNCGYIWPFVFDGVLAILDEIIERYPVDPKRIFVTGLSMGGYATWDLAMEYPNRFAGIVPGRFS
jgi:dienelactone hydrolase